jgi:hypothetical protein
MHSDAVPRGFAILTAMERDQYVTVLLHGFRAMCMYDELYKDHALAAGLFRKRLAELPASSRYTDTAWEKVEARVWCLLVHKEFEARGHGNHSLAGFFRSASDTDREN